MNTALPSQRHPKCASEHVLPNPRDDNRVCDTTSGMGNLPKTGSHRNFSPQNADGEDIGRQLAEPLVDSRELPDRSPRSCLRFMNLVMDLPCSQPATSLFDPSGPILFFCQASRESIRQTCHEFRMTADRKPFSSQLAETTDFF